MTDSTIINERMQKCIPKCGMEDGSWKFDAKGVVFKWKGDAGWVIAALLLRVL
jgi:hypothetical protein